MQGDCMHAPGEEEDEVGEALREELHAGEDAEEAVGVGRLGEAERGQQQLDGEDENALDGSTGGASLDERLAPSLDVNVERCTLIPTRWLPAGAITLLASES